MFGGSRWQERVVGATSLEMVGDSVSMDSRTINQAWITL